MSKVFNRSIRVVGHEREIDGKTVQVIEYDKNGDIRRAEGNTVPTGSGYSKGAIFAKLDAASGTKAIYENEGTKTSASFNLVGGVAAGEISLAQGSVLRGAASGVGEAHAAETAGQILVGDGTDVVSVAVSGDATLASSGALTIGSSKITNAKLAFGVLGTPIEHTSESDKIYDVYATTSSTHASTSYEPVLFHTTLTGAGQVGGRIRAFMTTNVALGSWSNAFKAEVTYGASGKTAGLGSALLAEMTMSAGTVDGSYSPLELELNVPSGASLGTATTLIYASVNGDDVATFDTSGYFFNLQGISAPASGKVFQVNTAAAATHALRVNILGTDYFLMLTDQGA